MVAQKDGIIKFFSLHNQHPIMSLDCGHTPLMAADWCPSDCLIIGAAAGSDWFRFDTSRSRYNLICQFMQHFTIHKILTLHVAIHICSELLVLYYISCVIMIKIYIVGFDIYQVSIKKWFSLQILIIVFTATMSLPLLLDTIIASIFNIVSCYLKYTYYQLMIDNNLMDS